MTDICHGIHHPSSKQANVDHVSARDTRDEGSIHCHDQCKGLVGPGLTGGTPDRDLRLLCMDNWARGLASTH